MLRLHKSAAARILAVALLVAAIIGVGLLKSQEKEKPLGKARPLDFSSTALSQFQLQHFLDGNFTIINDVHRLPGPVLQAFTEQDGSRLLMANPGKEFIAGDVIYDPSVPRKRLIFAGLSGEKCFVHYEQGGRAHQYFLALFKVTSSGTLEPLWRCSCTGPAKNIRDLRSQLVSAVITSHTLPIGVSKSR